MLSTLKHKLILLLQLIFVSIYIIFEELIWEGIAKPIYEFIHSLKVLQKVETVLHSLNRYVILVVFVILLGIVEVLGIYAGVLFVSGKMWHGVTLYLAKVPIAAFTFWIFRITEDKLMQFGWFKWMYDQIMKAIDWVKSFEMYQRTMDRVILIKTGIKKGLNVFKEKYFSKNSPFIEKIKSLYSAMKDSLRK